MRRVIAALVLTCASSVVASANPDLRAAQVRVVDQRLFDSRSGHVTVDGGYSGGGRVQAGSVTRITIAGRAGLPPVDPFEPLSVMLNVVAVQPAAPGYLRVTSCDAVQSATSNVNFGAGQTISNSVIRSTNDGDVCVFSSVETDLVVDLVRRVAWRFSGSINQRILDTRDGVGGSTLEPGEQRPIDVSSALFTDLMVLNVTAVNASGPGWLAFRPCESTPESKHSVLNVEGPAPVSNLVIAPRGWCLFSSVHTDVVVDWMGGLPVSLPSTGGAPGPGPWIPGPYAYPPLQRLVDTRLTAHAALEGGASTLVVPTTGPTSTVFLNVTVVDPAGDGYLVLFACTSAHDPVPPVSTVNFGAGDTVAHLTALDRQPGEGICAYSTSAANLVIDTSATYAS